MPNYLERAFPGVMITAAVTAAYASAGTLSSQARLIKFLNIGANDIVISWDGGVTDHDYIPAGSFALYDFTSNAVANAKLNVASATNFFAKTTAATSTLKIIYFFAE